MCCGKRKKSESQSLGVSLGVDEHRATPENSCEIKIRKGSPMQPEANHKSQKGRKEECSFLSL